MESIINSSKQMPMTLHKDKVMFQQLIKQTSDNFRISAKFVELDYWMTLMLNRIALSSQNDLVVLTGAFALSVAYRISNRVSDHLDILTINDNLTLDGIEWMHHRILDSIVADDLSVKKIEYKHENVQFPLITMEPCSLGKKKNKEERIVVDIKPIGIGHSYQIQPISCLIGDFLDKIHATETMIGYNILPFEVYVVEPCRILRGKMAMLSRLSCATDAIPLLTQYIRYFYDIFELFCNEDCARYVQSQNFKADYTIIFVLNKHIYVEPQGWVSFEPCKTPLILNFKTLWEQLYPAYEQALAPLVYSGHVPDKDVIQECFEELIAQITYIPDSLDIKPIKRRRIKERKPRKPHKNYHPEAQ
ncbi:hypothetical protein FACS1894201_10960 [Bacteroidia bacterium]|nr:hypothetical protein FACS1894201_10960 [Bacteroidia bacterium]